MREEVKTVKASYEIKRVEVEINPGVESNFHFGVGVDRSCAFID